MSRYVRYGHPQSSFRTARPVRDEVTTIWSTGEVVRQTRTGEVVQRPSVPPLHDDFFTPKPEQPKAAAGLNIDMEGDLL